MKDEEPVLLRTDTLPIATGCQRNGIAHEGNRTGCVHGLSDQTDGLEKSTTKTYYNLIFSLFPTRQLVVQDTNSFITRCKSVLTIMMNQVPLTQLDF